MIENREQQPMSSELPRIGRDLTPEERTAQLLMENAEVRDRAAFNFWHATYQPDQSEFFAAEVWRALAPWVRSGYADEMMSEVRAYHAMSPAERELHNRGQRAALLRRNDAVNEGGEP